MTFKSIIDRYHPAITQALLNYKEVSEWTTIQKSVLMNESELGVLAVSPTGSGKTIAFLLPLLSSLVEKPKRPSKGLIISPTKELCMQTMAIAKKMSIGTNLLSLGLWGEKNLNEELRQLKNGAHLIHACPGRLLTHLRDHHLNLSGIEWVILDEGDQLMDMGFLPVIKEIFLHLKNPECKRWIFSASASVENQMELKSFLPENYFFYEEKNTEVVDRANECYTIIGDQHRYQFLKFLIKDLKIKKLIIFVRTKEDARQLHQNLRDDQYPSVHLEGDMSTHARLKAWQEFESPKGKILVATDVAARGLDFKKVGHIINYGIPESRESYVHRGGRTARYNLSGMIITIVPDTRHVISVLGEEIGQMKFPHFNIRSKN